MRFRPERSRFAHPRSATAAWMLGALLVTGVGSPLANAGDAGSIAMAAATKAASIDQLTDVPPPAPPAGLIGLGSGSDQRPTLAITPVVAKVDVSPEVAPPPVARAPSAVAAPMSSPSVASPASEWVPAGTFPFDAAKNDLRGALDRFVKAAPGASRYRFASVSPVEQRRSVATYYAAHGYAPIWVTDGRWNAAARSAMETLAQSPDDGLDLADFPVPAAVEPTGRLDAELALSNAVAAYAFQARGGRINPTRLSLQIGAKPTLADAASVLDALARAGNPGRVLQGYNPPQPEYAALRDKLAELRGHLPVARATIPSGPALKVGMRDPRVSLIRARFALSPASDRGDEMVYDTVVASAVAHFQRANGLPPSGVLTMRTIAALSGPQSSALVKEIIANMERWRWMPRDMGSERVVVNIPDYALKVYRDGEVIHEARVIVGKPDAPTPVFSDRMRYLTVNPAWYVPPSIIHKELLPHVANDPRYLTRLGYEVFRRGNTLIVRQPPGDRNALGHVVFMFPNQYSVYLHDTPARGLFGAEKRAFSHGCVRVDQPLKLAETLLGADAGWTEERLRRLLGPREKTISMARQIMVHLTYFTAGVDSLGDVRVRPDIYGYSKRVRTALGLEG